MICLLAAFLAKAGYGEDYAHFRSQELQCLIGNNAPVSEHRAGYNGIFHLTSIHQSKTIFVPAYAGFNLEHVFDGSAKSKDDRNIFFEPRHAPMNFRKIGERTAELHQPPTPFWGMESTTTFELIDPCYIDVTFRCTPRKENYEGGAFGLFWASYINGPLNKSMYFLRRNGSPFVWQQFCTQYHDHDSTIRHENDSFRWTFSPDVPTRLFTEISPVEFAEPFYYGRFKNMALIVMFENAKGLRLSHSPSGGGSTPAGDDTNPAWDFQFIVPDYEIGKEYTLRYRIAYKPWAGRDDVLNEYNRFRNRYIAAHK